jgi:hypothetical protein
MDSPLNESQAIVSGNTNEEIVIPEMKINRFTALHESQMADMESVFQEMKFDAFDIEIGIKCTEAYAKKIMKNEAVTRRHNHKMHLWKKALFNYWRDIPVIDGQSEEMTGFLHGYFLIMPYASTVVKTKIASILGVSLNMVNKTFIAFRHHYMKMIDD